MPLGEKKVRRLTGLLLTIAVVVSRLPFISRMLFEFDSVDFAVATFRFSLEQVTPHFPGYILHILFAKFLLLISDNINLAFVWVSIMLSIGSVLFLWRAGANLRGERVGVIAAILWLFTPIFWFYGEVATAYVYEAFFASVFLYLGISLLRKPHKRLFVYLLFIALSLATGARQSSILFFVAPVIYILWKTRQPYRVCLSGIGLFIVITALWLSILFSFSGGVAEYFAQAGSETVYKSQSVLFGNSFRSHLAVVGKVFLYFITASIPLLLIFCISLFRYTKKSIRFIKEQQKKASFIFTLLVALSAFLFYIGIYFMKAGYLLNILPSLVLCGAVLLDQMGIWEAERVKRSSEDIFLLTRPLITGSAIRYCVSIMAFVFIIFFSKFPWLNERNSDNSFTFDSFNTQESLSDPKYGGGTSLILNKLFSFTNIHTVVETDALHSKVLQKLDDEAKESSELVLLDTWWHRWGYYYKPKSLIYDIRDFPFSDSLWIGKSVNYMRKGIADSVINIPHGKKVLLLLRHDHPTFSKVASQVHLERLDLPEYLDIYRITDDRFSLKWKNIRFVRE